MFILICQITSHSLLAIISCNSKVRQHKGEKKQHKRNSTKKQKTMIYRILNRILKIRKRLPTIIRDDSRCSGRVGSSWTTRVTGSVNINSENST